MTFFSGNSWCANGSRTTSIDSLRRRSTQLGMARPRGDRAQRVCVSTFSSAGAVLFPAFLRLGDTKTACKGLLDPVSLYFARLAPNDFGMVYF
jgi:hypothetical protein